MTFGHVSSQVLRGEIFMGLLGWKLDQKESRLWQAYSKVNKIRSTKKRKKKID